MTQEPKPKVLVVDDDPVLVEQFSIFLETASFDVEVATSVEDGWRKVRQLSPHLVFCDLYLGMESGLELLGRIRQRYPTLPVVMISALPSTESSGEALRYQAFDFLEKPIRMETLIATAKRALETKDITGPKITWIPRMMGLIGESEAMREVWVMVDRSARVDSPILISGEAGTGKELLARAIHRLSSRKHAPFVAIDVRSLPPRDQLLDLFGTTGQRGRAMQASSGTIYLHEVSALTPPAQEVLERMLETRGDFRIIVGLDQGSRDVVPALSERLLKLGLARVRLPPLRERGGDVLLLAKHFLLLFSRELGKPGLIFGPGVRDYLACRTWPGNVPELMALVRRAVLRAEGPVIDLRVIAATSSMDPTDPDIQVGMTLEEARRRLARATVATLAGNISRAAQVLGVDRKTLMRLTRPLPRGAGSV